MDALNRLKEQSQFLSEQVDRRAPSRRSQSRTKSRNLKSQKPSVDGLLTKLDEISRNPFDPPRVTGMKPGSNYRPAIETNMPTYYGLKEEKPENFPNFSIPTSKHPSIAESPYATKDEIVDMYTTFVGKEVFKEIPGAVAPHGAKIESKVEETKESKVYRILEKLNIPAYYVSKSIINELETRNDMTMLQQISKKTSFLDLMLFDNSELETHSPEEWVSLGPNSGLIGTPARSWYYFSKTIGDTDSDGKIKDGYYLEPCFVLDYEKKTEKYVVKFMHNEQVKKVKRYNLLFDAEDQSKWEERWEEAKKRREEKERDLRFNLYVEDLLEKNVDLQTLPPVFLENIINSIGPALRFARPPNYIAFLLQQIVKEVRVNFKRAMIVAKEMYLGNDKQYKEQLAAIGVVIPFREVIVPLTNSLLEGTSEQLPCGFVKTTAMFISKRLFNVQPHLNQLLNTMYLNWFHLVEKEQFRLLETFQGGMSFTSFPLTVDSFSELQMRKSAESNDVLRKRIIPSVAELLQTTLEQHDIDIMVSSIATVPKIDEVDELLLKKLFKRLDKLCVEQNLEINDWKEVDLEENEGKSMMEGNLEDDSQLLMDSDFGDELLSVEMEENESMEFSSKHISRKNSNLTDNTLNSLQLPKQNHSFDEIEPSFDHRISTQSELPDMSQVKIATKVKEFSTEQIVFSQTLSFLRVVELRIDDMLFELLKLTTEELKMFFGHYIGRFDFDNSIFDLDINDLIQK
eukprot:TRINITY_DN2798_c0_g1_i1.p1 TRINITY_DN2798_c0_g1~~TRINITY_DN2798_c0_g1_i1.p1  ORF type:complete len:750 (+),score=228.10 TRINITY_DN2798_c0_g1_i1:30-2252(+)